MRYPPLLRLHGQTLLAAAATRPSNWNDRVRELREAGLHFLPHSKLPAEQAKWEEGATRARVPLAALMFFDFFLYPQLRFQSIWIESGYVAMADEAILKLSERPSPCRVLTRGMFRRIRLRMAEIATDIHS